MKVLVTGGAGFIGSHLVDALIKEGNEISVLVRRGTDLGNLENARVHRLTGDVGDRASLHTAVKGIDVVYHLAAMATREDVPDSTYYEVNVDGTTNLLEACIESGVKRFIFCSSVNVFGSDQASPLNEESPCFPDDILGRSKFAAEKKVGKMCQGHGMPFTIIRPSRVYGPRDRSLLKLFRLVGRPYFRMIGDGSNLMMPVYVGDLVDALVRCLVNERAFDQVYIIAGGEVVSKREFCGMVADSIGRRRPPGVYVPLRLACLAAAAVETISGILRIDPPISRKKMRFFSVSRHFDTSKAEKDLEFRPDVDLRAGIKLTADWYRNHGFL